ncbi:RHS repeat-associated core domain-containing protein [Pseudomonas sp. C1C7]|uniref:RHS repeat-associated core domain-containing protein n=1 Tax=Pseudomonas sp. C1C7 TaxID=2735272 RepID=UPI0015868448|nr:RHS repeat-associated core domain-containing protein [Pseudomonas sp. C1C7]NUT79171.1 RHS repeat-associated core domain-containing protein [Pseudomonas sp. C1C7]
MQPESEALLCQYHYDAQDRLVASTPLAQARIQRFYQQDRMTTETQGKVQWSILQHGEQPLAQQRRQDASVENRLFATDLQCSVLNVLDARQPNPLAYTPYGHSRFGNGLPSLLGFNGERREPLTGWYLLGNGYRAFNPVLMRFNSPDSWSPFGEGGLNAYMYCVGDPINQADDNGHAPNFFSIGRALLPSFTKRPSTRNIAALSGPMSEIKSINQGISVFTDTYKGAKRLNLMGHGTEQPVNGYHKIIGDGKTFTPEQLYESAINSGVAVSDYENIRLIMCYSANGGTASFAQRFSDIAKKPVKGYVNPVSVEPGIDRMTYMLQYPSTSLRKQTDGSLSFDKIKIFKKNPYLRGTPERRKFSYQPVKFNPR